MKPDIFFRTIVDPALKTLADTAGVPSDDRAGALVMAIAGQESNWAARRQDGGPARSYWQFERYGGVAEVLQKCPKQLGAVCAAWDIPVDGLLIFEAMAWHDGLACCMARLLLWPDPAPLPELGQRDAAWEYYRRNWRPGLPRPEHWFARYDTALALIR